MIHDLKAGIYQHYKGPRYLVLGLAHDANADILLRTDDTPGEREVVVYVGLQMDQAHTGARLAVRTVADFFAWVHDLRSPQEFGSICEHRVIHSRNGPFCHCGSYSNQHIVQRFSYLGARL